jgi:hypothetical protein
MTTNNSTTPFADFEAVALLPADAAEIVYGVNVLQIEASVRTIETGTVAELVEKYRAQLGLPNDVVVFVDGVKLGAADSIPADARRIEIVKPSGEKGAQLLSATPKIPLDRKDAILIRILRLDTVNYTAARTELYGAMSEDLALYVTLKDGAEAIEREGGQIYIGRRITETKATRFFVSEFAQEWRRVQGGVALVDKLSIKKVRASYPTALEFHLNFAICPPNLHNIYPDLNAGDVFDVVISGETRTADFGEWVKAQRELAESRYHNDFLIKRHNKRAYRIQDLEKMSWIKLRLTAAKAGVKVAGLGRTAKKIIDDLIAVEFPEPIGEAEFIASWLKENAPEVLEA